MVSRSQRTPKERDARSRAVRQVADSPLLRGSLVRMMRTCGKQGCHCQKGEKHPGLYLAVSDQGKRRLVYIPPALEETVQAWVGTARDIDDLLDLISEHCYQELLRKKAKILQRPRKSRRNVKGERSPP